MRVRKRGGKGRSGRAAGRSMRLLVSGRGWSTALLVADGCRAGVGVGA